MRTAPVPTVLVRIPRKRSLAYECHQQRNLKTMRGAKGNALLLRGATCNAVSPCVALVPNSLAVVLRYGQS